jgi:DNA-directed RNA polymerase alpha subunit
MDAIVNELANGKTISDALKAVFSKRTVQIRYTDAKFDVPVTTLGMSRRSTNALMRNGVHTITDLTNYSMNNGIQSLRGCGKDSMTEIMETILNYAWEHMTEKEKIAFLMNTVNMNERNLKDIL